MAPGDVVVIYSDGVTEAVDGDDQEFGDERLCEVVNRYRTRSAADIRDALFDAVERHQSSQPQYDDITAVVIKRTE
jgi:sigma-B regulation protein RsbU (phosphoserine phosphatase)